LVLLGFLAASGFFLVDVVGLGGVGGEEAGAGFGLVEVEGGVAELELVAGVGLARWAAGACGRRAGLGDLGDGD
jgi:hypothetical protein